MMGWNMAWGGMFWAGFFGLLILVALVVLAVQIMRGIGAPNGSRSSWDKGEPARKVETPLEILQTRYAKGEIESDDFEARRRTLENIAGPSG